MIWILGRTRRDVAHLYLTDEATRAMCGFQAQDPRPAGEFPSMFRSSSPQTPCAHCELALDARLRRDVA